MSISESFVLPCGLTLPNRLCKAAMAENMSIDGLPDDKHLKAYGEWADGQWGLVLTGKNSVVLFHHLELSIGSTLTNDGWKEMLW